TAYTSKIPAGHFRATGKTQTTFGIECTIDSVARQMGLSPFELRLKNAMRRGEPVASTWKVQGEPCPADAPPLDTDFADLMQRALGAIGWDGRPIDRAAPAEAAASGGARAAN